MNDVETECEIRPEPALSERVLTLIANQLRTSGYNVSIITFGKCENHYENQCPVVTVEYTNDFNQINRLRSAIKELRPEVVIAFEYYIGMKTIIATRGFNIKTIVSERNDPHKLDSQPIKRLLRDFLYKKTDILVCQTDDAKAYFEKKGAKNSVVISNPIKGNLPVWNEQSCQKVIINFCKLEKQKNLPLLIEAFAEVYKKHSDFVLHIYGEGTEKHSLHQLIYEKNLDNVVKIMPFSNNIHEIASKCYMFVSSSDFEGLSNSMLEAMAMGMPVICTDCPIGGAKMVIKNGINGMLIPIQNEKKLAKAIETLIEHRNKCKEIASNALKVNETYSLDNVTNVWKTIL